MILEAIVYLEDEEWKYLVSMTGAESLNMGPWLHQPLPLDEAVVDLCLRWGEDITKDMVTTGRDCGIYQMGHNPKKE